MHTPKAFQKAFHLATLRENVRAPPAPETVGAARQAAGRREQARKHPGARQRQEGTQVRAVRRLPALS